MNTKNNGGAAFPSFSRTGDYTSIMPEGGMSLRDFFAAQALTGLLAAPGFGAGPTELAKEAYKIADKMLEAREAK